MSVEVIKIVSSQLAHQNYCLSCQHYKLPYTKILSITQTTNFYYFYNLSPADNLSSA